MADLNDDLAQKIQWVVDLEQIKTLMAKYCHGIDKKDEQTFMSIWADDADYLLPRGEGHGIDGVRELVRKVWREVPQCHHHITNPVIDVQGEVATAATDVFYFRLTADGTRVLLSGTYAFEFVKRDERWQTRSVRFASLSRTARSSDSTGYS
ncbi:nuclear transport factor 2 family protein [Nocardia ignorata]|uniref:SnoaL-like protein n=1 Tax=Nocardia ignorata TaxID=145285 RepID=A0A4R6PJK4_NOCIG|nr:nuclear transport factor 2 family protein [Nocardia ignorata]TDP37783.1 SnoaL-like protein [Nocardia ignorata]